MNEDEIVEKVLQGELVICPAHDITAGYTEMDGSWYYVEIGEDDILVKKVKTASKAERKLISFKTLHSLS